MLVIGAAFVVPWTSFITPADYFQLVYPERNFEYVLPVVNFVTLLIGTLVMSFGGATKLRIEGRIGYSLAIITCLMFVVPVLDVLLLREAVSEHASFLTTMISVFGIACANSVFQSSVYGLAAVLGHPSYINAIEMGKGVAGCGVCLIRMLTKYLFASSSDKVQNRASQSWALRCFFGSSLALLVSALGLFVFLLNMRWTKQKLGVFYKDPQYDDNQPIKKKLWAGGYGSSDSTNSSALERGRAHSSDNNVASAPVVAGKIAKCAGTAFATFTVTICCFPGMMTSLHSTTFGLGDWFPVVLVTLYNASDLAGKYLPSVGVKLLREGTLLYGVCAHLMFIPLFIFAATAGVGSIFTSDFLVFLLVIGLGLSTGYMGCMAMILGPQQVDTHEKELAGVLDSLALITGLCVGSVIGLGLSFVLHLQ